MVGSCPYWRCPVGRYWVRRASSSKVASSAAKAKDSVRNKQLETLMQEVKDTQNETHELNKALRVATEGAERLTKEMEANDTRIAGELIATRKQLATLMGTKPAVPEWLATIDCTTGNLQYINTRTNETSVATPDAYDGTFGLKDATTGVYAMVKLAPGLPIIPT